jgi:ABC-type uncharacterized transport system substrate-binding protein
VTNMNLISKKVVLALLSVSVLISANDAFAAKCLYISSYHKGYEWSDGIERGLLSELEGKCEFKQFDMDTKRNDSEELKKESALQAKKLIESFQPDVVIVSDDNAVKYLVEPYYKDSSLPFVFCGVNWSGEKYGLPYKNVTGMVEVALISAQINVIKTVLPEANKVFYLDSDNETGQKNVIYYKKYFEEKGYQFTSQLVKTFDEWKSGFITGQEYDVVVLTNNSGIKEWNNDEAKKFAQVNTKKYSLTENDWMMPYTLIGMTKVPEEQGMWSGKTAVSILGGADPGKIKIVENNKSNIFINKALKEKLNFSIPVSLVNTAKIVE